MKRALAPIVLVLLLGLSGCVSVETSESRVEVTPGASGTYGNGDSTVVVEPLTAETPVASADSGEAAFLERVRSELRPDNVIPNATDEQLLTAGREACERRAAGEASDTISVIKDEPKSGIGYYVDSGVIITAARNTLCAD